MVTNQTHTLTLNLTLTTLNLTVNTVATYLVFGKEVFLSLVLSFGVPCCLLFWFVVESCVVPFEVCVCVCVSCGGVFFVITTLPLTLYVGPTTNTNTTKRFLRIREKYHKASALMASHLSSGVILQDHLRLAFLIELFYWIPTRSYLIGFFF